MKDALIVVGVCLAMLLAVLGVQRFDASGAPLDEILAYEVDAERGVEVTLHGGVQQVSLTSWVVLPLDTPGDEELPYGLDVRLTDVDGNVRMSRRYENYTRLPLVTSQDGVPRTSLAGGVSYVSEPRTVTVNVDPLGNSAGRLRVTASPGKYSRVLLRLAHRVERTRFEKALLARTMNTLERSDLMAGRSSLGFLDIPDEVRAEALSHWHQRLTAAGREGRDYTVRRLLIGPKVPPPAEPEWVGNGFESSPTQQLAINLAGPVTLRVWSAAATNLQVDLVGRDAPSFHAIGARGWIELTLESEGLATAIFAADPPSRLAFGASLAARGQFFRSEPPRENGRWLEVAPEIVRQRAYRLDPVQPMVLGVAPGQPRLGLSVRSLRAGGERAEGRLRVLWQNGRGEQLSSEEFELSFGPSQFEHVDGEEVSERELLQLHVEPAAERALIVGDEDLLATPFVPEPGVEESVMTPPFDAEPPEGLRWRYAPLDIKDWALIRPDDEEELRRSGRELSVQCQLRLEPTGREGIPIAPRTLEPRGQPLSRPVFVPTTYSPRYPFPDNGWVLFEAQRSARDVVIAPPGELSILYVADAERLGQSWSLRSSTDTVYAGPLYLRSGARRLELPLGEQHLEVEGLGARGLLLAQAAPRGGGVILRRQTFYALDRGRQLDFDFLLRPGELASLYVTIATEGQNADVTLAHAIDGGRPVERAKHFRHRMTDFERVQQLRTGALGEALIWSEPFSSREVALPDRLGRALVTLGDDLLPGPHRLTLRHPPGGAAARNRYWVRAVLVGRVLGHP